MNQTTNYQLSQWESTDRILMSDFNSDNAKLDEALAGLAAASAGHGNCRVESFTYTGSGGYGTSSPTLIQFSRKPVFFMIFGDAFLAYGHYGDAQFTGFLRNPKSSDIDITVLTPSWNGTQVALTCPYSIEHQGNVDGRVYRVIALYAMDESE